MNEAIAEKAWKIYKIEISELVLPAKRQKAFQNDDEGRECRSKLYGTKM